MPNVTEYDMTNFDFAMPIKYLQYLAEHYIMDFVYNPAVFLTTIMLMIFGCWLLRRWISSGSSLNLMLNLLPPALSPRR